MSRPPSSARRTAGVATLVTAVATALAATACSGGHASRGQASASLPTGSLTVTVTDGGCVTDHPSIGSGPTSITVRDAGASNVDEVEVRLGQRVLAEAEALGQGGPRRIPLRLYAGDYVVTCTGATHPSSTFRVVGDTAPVTRDPAAAQALARGVSAYSSWVRGQVARLVVLTRRLDTAVERGQLSTAIAAYPAARVRYERIEPVAESFTTGGTNLDTRIDARIDDVPAGQWHGFHPIERALFAEHTTVGVRADAVVLTRDVTRLEALVATARYQPAQLAEGAESLLTEVATTKISGEEERWSHLDVLDMAANLAGAEEAFTDLQAGLQLIDPTLTTTLLSRFAATDQLLAGERDPQALGGWRPYPQLSARRLRTLADSVRALADPLSQVAPAVVRD